MASNVDVRSTRDARFVVHAAHNLMHTEELISVFRTPGIDTAKARRFLRNVFDWQGDSNVYASVQAFAAVSRGMPETQETLLRTFADWCNVRTEVNSAVADVQLVEEADESKRLSVHQIEWLEGERRESFGAD